MCVCNERTILVTKYAQVRDGPGQRVADDRYRKEARKAESSKQADRGGVFHLLRADEKQS